MTKIGQLHDIDLKTLRVFCTIVEEGGFTAAQTSLNLSQSSLSEYLKSLEVRLGMTLCQRGPKGFQLYEDGKKVYAAAREMFFAIDSFKDQITSINRGTVGQITIAIQDAIASNPSSRLSEALRMFEQAYPRVRVKVEMMLGFQVMGRVADNVVPLGICLLRNNLPQVTSTTIFGESAHLYCSDKHSLFSEDTNNITEEQVREYRYCSRAHLEWAHPEWGGDALTNDVGFGAEAQLALILSGRAIGYMPDHIAAPFLHGGSLKQIKGRIESTVNPVALISGPGMRKFRLASKLSDMIVEAHKPLAER